MGKQEQLIQSLADGAVHSGAELARALDCSRTAVWKHVHQLRSMGLETNSARGRGYQLQHPLELLDAEAIRKEWTAGSPVESLEVHSVIASTSECLRSMPPPASGKIRAVLAEYQTQGRGRRGREWLSPYGSGLCLSVSRCFADVPPALPALSLAAGVAVNRALLPLEPDGLGLKWPNDIVASGGKLGGLLIDVFGESGGPITVVIGVGINIGVSEELSGQLSRGDAMRPVGLRQVCSAGPVLRNALAARTIDELQSMLTEFGHSGFVDFRDEWLHFDCMRGQPVTVRTESQAYSGVAAGIDVDGALLLDEDGDIRTVLSGDVTLRPSS